MFGSYLGIPSLAPLRGLFDSARFEVLSTVPFIVRPPQAIAWVKYAFKFNEGTPRVWDASQKIDKHRDGYPSFFKYRDYL